MNWINCLRCGRRHFGRYGAAGLLLSAEGYVLLVRRGAETESGTWSIPGGARERGESAAMTALREAREETCGIPALDIEGARAFTDHHVDWTYTTVIMPLSERFPIRPRPPATGAAEWVRVEDVETLPNLHPAFKASWRGVRRIVEENTLAA